MKISERFVKLDSHRELFRAEKKKERVLVSERISVSFLQVFVASSMFWPLTCSGQIIRVPSRAKRSHFEV